MLGNIEISRSLMGKDAEAMRKAKEGVNLQTYSHGHCGMFSSLQVSGPHGTSC